MRWNPITYLAWGFDQNAEHDVMASAIVRATLPLYEPIWGRGDSRRLKESAKEPSLWGHNRSSCKAFGKSVTTKEHSGLSQAPALCPLPHTPMRRWGTEIAVKGRGICLGCKLATTLAVTRGGGVRKSTSCWGDDDDDDDTPKPNTDAPIVMVWDEKTMTGNL